MSRRINLACSDMISILEQFGAEHALRQQHGNGGAAVEGDAPCRLDGWPRHVRLVDFIDDGTGETQAVGSDLPHRHLPGIGLAPLPPDRKSTRLNSSHLVISYAVFCLKKKKTIEREVAPAKSQQSYNRYTTYQPS